MPHTGSAFGDSTQINRPGNSHPSPTLPTSRSENAEEGTAAVAAVLAETASPTAATVAAVPVETAAPTTAVVLVEAARQAKEPSQSVSLEATQAEVTHQGYRNTQVSVTILKRHEGQEAEHIHSFDITDPTFEKEILS